MSNQFQGESPRNLLEKCLCVLVMDVSGTMNPHMPVLNQALKEFFKDIETDNGLPEGTKDQLEICIEQFDCHTIDHGLFLLLMVNPIRTEKMK